MWCQSCGKKIGVSEAKVTLQHGYRCQACEYRIQMGRSPDMVPLRDRPE